MAQAPIPQLPVDPTKGQGATGPLGPLVPEGQKGPLSQLGSQLGGQAAADLGVAKGKDAVEPFGQILKSLKVGELPDAQKFVLSTISKDLYKEGMLPQVLAQAGEAILKFTEAKQIIQNAVQEQMGQDFKALNVTLQPLVTISKVPEGGSFLNIPAMTESVKPEVSQTVLPLIAQSAVGTIREFLHQPPLKGPIAPGSTPIPTRTPTPTPTLTPTPTVIRTLSPAATTGALAAVPLTPEEEVQSKAQGLVSALIELKVSTQPSRMSQIIIPKEADTSSLAPQQLASLQQSITTELEKTAGEFQQMFKVAEGLKINTLPLQIFREAPQRALELLKNMPATEQAFVLSFLGIWCANKKVVEGALLNQPYVNLMERRESIKALIAITPSMDMTGRPLTQQEQKLNLLDQLLLAVPSFANFLTIEQLLSELENIATQQTLAGLHMHRMLLINAAKEIIRVASGKKSAEYVTVGLLHPQLEILSKLLAAKLPEKSEKLDHEKLHALSKLIQENLEVVKSENIKLFDLFLQRHPRATLYLLHTESKLLEGTDFPELPETTQSHARIAVLEQLLAQLTAVSSFQNYQPQVLLQLTAEAKRDPAAALSRNSIKIIYRAATQTVDSLRPEEKNLYQDLLQAFLV